MAELNRFIKIVIDTVFYEDMTTVSNDVIQTQDNENIQGTKGYHFSNEDSSFGIAEGSLNIEEILCEDSLQLGKVCSSKLEVELFNLDIDVTGGTIEVSSITNNVSTPLFKGVIESAVKDNYSHSRKIVAYDKMYFDREVNVAPWWTEFWQNKTTTTMKELRESLCTEMGLTYSSLIVLPNDAMEVPQYNMFTSITFADMLRMICEAQACIPHITRTGGIDFITISSDNMVDISSLYEKNTSEFEDYTTRKITGINIYNSSNEFTYNYGLTDNAYVITGNIFLMSLSQENLVLACQNIFNAIQNIEYKPATINLLESDFSLQVGRRIDTNLGTHYILAQTFSDALLVNQQIRCDAAGEELDSSAINRNKDIIDGKRYSTIQQEVDQISTRVTNVQRDLTGQINDVSSSITQTATNVTTQILSNQKVLTAIVVDDNGVTISSDTIETNLVLDGAGMKITDNSQQKLAEFTKDSASFNDWIMQQQGANFNIFRNH